VKTSDGVLIGYIDEGVTTSLSFQGHVIDGVTIEDEGLPFRIGDSFRVTSDSIGGNKLVVFTPAPYTQFLGFGQIFTNALRASNIDTTQGYALEAYRGWDVNLGYRAGGLIATDDLSIFTDTDTLPESAYTLRFKRSQYAQDLWAQALRVTVVQFGSTTTASNGFTVPSNDASDWVFRIEGYNSRYLGFKYFTLDNVQDRVTFNALGGAHTNHQWFQSTIVTGTQDSQLPITVTGLQHVVNILFGYSDYLTSQGWRFNDDGIQNIDAQTGRVRNWQLEIEKLIDAVYAGIQLGEGQVLNPFIDRIWLDQDVGLLSRYFDTALFDVTGHPGVFDTLGVSVGSLKSVQLCQCSVCTRRSTSTSTCLCSTTCHHQAQTLV
jgi:hypothetical protein